MIEIYTLNSNEGSLFLHKSNDKYRISLKITFLGTGTSQGVPVIACQCKTCQSENSKDKRLRSSVLIQQNNNNFIIDAGPDFRQQVLNSGIQTLAGILITHGHKDHVGGLDDVRAFNYQQRKPMNVYAAKFAFPDLRREFHYAFEENKYPGSPEINLIEVRDEIFEAGGLNIQPIFTEHYKKPCLAFRMGGFTYITDTNYISAREKEKINDSEIIVLNALRKEKHISHFNLEEALALLEEFKPRKAYLTHISHLMGLHEEVNKELPDYVELAYDGLSFEIEV